MTLAIAIKINDGLVIAADSATTMSQQTPDGQTQIINIYENANKVINLHKKLPVGIITWGLGNIGSSSFASLAKDFRSLIMYHEQKKIDESSYSVADIAHSFFEFIYTEKYQKAAIQQAVGFLIAGYSSGQDHPEEWLIQIDNKGNCNGPELLRGYDDTGCNWFGQPEAITRLIRGHSGALEIILQMAGIEADKIKIALELCAQNLTTQMVMPSMPLQDAIDLAEYLIQTTINYVKYTPPGHKTVGGPIEIAAITKHEGFKWINRKLYFNGKYNPKEEL